MDLPAGILTLQRIDRWVGAPLCAILTLLRGIFESAGRAGPRQVQRILFVKFAEQGSTVLAYPAILRAIEMVGRENVYFVLFDDNRFILDAMDIIPDGNVITIATNSVFGLATGAHAVAPSWPRNSGSALRSATISSSTHSRSRAVARARCSSNEVR